MGGRSSVSRPTAAGAIRNRFALLALLGNIHVVDLHVRGLHGEASWLSLLVFLSSFPAAFHFNVCRTESDRVGLEMQATWFGRAGPKSPFSKHPIRRQSVLCSGRCSLAVGKNSKQVGLLEICSSRMDTDLPGYCQLRAALFTRARVRSRKAKI